MIKVKIKRLFKLQPNDRLFKAGQEVELAEHEVKAVQEQLGDDFLEVIQEIEDNEIDFDAMNVTDLENWLEENDVDFNAKAKKPEKVALAKEKAKELEEQEENVEE